MPSERERPVRLSLQRLSCELAALSSAGLSADQFRREAAARICHVIPVDAYCFSNADPDSLVLTAVDVVNGDRSLARVFYDNEYGQPDFAKHHQLAWSKRAVRVLHLETCAEPERSRRYRELVRPMGLEYELRAAARDRSGTWGFLHLYRSPDGRDFDAGEVHAIQRASPQLAAGLRAAATRPGHLLNLGDPPGVMLVSGEDRLLRRSGAVGRWLAVMHDPMREGPNALPEVVQSIATSARRLAPAQRDGGSHVLLRAADDSWWLVDAFVDEDGRQGECAADADCIERQVTIVVQPASGPRFTRIMMRGLGLSPSEREVCQHLLAGHSNKEIADELYLSPYTIQDRLKRVFAKAAVGSRQELVAQLNPACRAAEADLTPRAVAPRRKNANTQT